MMHPKCKCNFCKQKECKGRIDVIEEFGMEFCSSAFCDYNVKERKF